jgi:putative protease
MAEKEVGEIIHYYDRIGVAIIKLNRSLKTGETIHIKGAKTDFAQKVDSMQIEHKDIDEAKKGESVGLKVNEQVKESDKVFAVSKK